MAGRTNIPTSPACGHWETLLAEALDGLLRPEDEPTFTSHMAGCVACAALFEEARRGREWLDFLSAEPEIPAGLLDRILAQTGPGQVGGFGLVGAGSVASAPGGIPLHSARPLAVPRWQKPGLMAFVRRFAEPRLMMTAAMAFFSIALTLNLTGVRLADLHWSNLRPTAVRSFMQRQITVAYTPIIRYYDHLRLVYEVQSRVRELRHTNETETNDHRKQTGPGESKNPNHKDGGSRVEPPQQSVTPVLNDDNLETSLSLHDQPAHSGGSAKTWERSTKWTA